MIKKMNLPTRALALIREYSKPMTRPDWRDRQWICVVDLVKDIARLRITKPDKRFKLYKRIFMGNMQNGFGGVELYLSTLENGIHATSIVSGINEKILRYLVYKN
jgi:hypothetical protein